MHRLPAIFLALALIGASAPGCSGSGSGDSSSLMTGSRGTGSTAIPGDVRRAGREGINITPQKQLTDAEIEANRNRSIAVAERLWTQAEAVEAGNPEGAGDAYGEIADNHPESPRAAEAKFREGRCRFREREYRDSFAALKRYMEIAPTNPNLAEIEQMVFESGQRYLAGIRGLAGMFKSEDEGYAMLQYVSEAFPNGRLADDALLALGDALYREDDKDRWIEAVQHYRALLLRYPDSELRPAAWLGLAQTYLVRDQGFLWHAGFVDVDPREATPEDPQQAAFAGAVRSAPMLALEAYTALLDEERVRPGCASAANVAAAESGVLRAKRQLADKDARIASYYGGANGGAAADPYRRSAAALRGEPAPPPLARPVLPPAAPPNAAPPNAAPPPTGIPPTGPGPTPPLPAGTTPTQPPVPAPGSQPPGPPPSATVPVVPPAVPLPPPATQPPPVVPDPFPPATSNPPAAPPGLPSALPPPKVRRNSAR